MARYARRPLLGAVAIGLVLSGCLGPGDRVAPAELSPPPVDHPPTAVVTAATEAHVGEPVFFDASDSTDTENNTLHYAWDLGDGAVQEGPRVIHTYGDPGVYNVTLNVTDAGGQSDTAAVAVHITTPPPSDPIESEPWSVTDSLQVANPAMENLGRPVPFANSGWPLVGGERLEDFQRRSLGAGIDHELYQVQTPTNGSHLFFVLEWDPVAMLPLIESSIDLDLFVFDPDGRLLPGGFTAATGNVPEMFPVEAAEHLTRGTYQVLVLLYRGADVDFTVRASLTTVPVAGASTV